MGYPTSENCQIRQFLCNSSHCQEMALICHLLRDPPHPTLVVALADKDCQDWQTPETLVAARIVKIIDFLAANRAENRKLET